MGGAGIEGVSGKAPGGDGEGTARWLARAVEDGSWVDLYPEVNTAFGAYRDDPGFQEALRGVRPS